MLNLKLYLTTKPNGQLHHLIPPSSYKRYSNCTCISRRIINYAIELKQSAVYEVNVGYLHKLYL